MKNCILLDKAKVSYKLGIHTLTLKNIVLIDLMILLFN